MLRACVNITKVYSYNNSISQGGVTLWQSDNDPLARPIAHQSTFHCPPTYSSMYCVCIVLSITDLTYTVDLVGS